LILTKKDDIYKVYVDPNDPSVVPAEILLKVNPDVFNIKWYERFGMMGDFGASPTYDLELMYKIFYMFDITKTFQISPYADVRFSMKMISLKPFFGVNFIYYPFR
jgi:hypothetical protein